ncbi:MAG: OB-fold domain-containing protein [Sphingomonadales bacterium]|nr:OB-fold domain-containing protein [Sphingomonadales bacterium]
MISTAPAIADIPLPIDQWTQPFWSAACRCELVMPCCADCGTWRWPPGPFCPHCLSQAIAWQLAGPARLYSFAIVHRPGPTPADSPQAIVPGLVEFPEAGGMRIAAAIIDSKIDRIAIGSALSVRWVPKDETNVPMFVVV